MTKETRLKIINLCKFVFEDAEFTKVMFYLQRNQLNDLRLFIDEKCELLSITTAFNVDEVELQQYRYCQELEDLILEVVIDTIA